MEKVGSVMTLDEMKEKMDRHNKMVSDARAGNDPICPKCKKGHIKCKGKYFFYCRRTRYLVPLQIIRCLSPAKIIGRLYGVTK